MRLGLAGKIVAVVACVLAIALAIVGDGARRYEMRLLAGRVAPAPPLPAVAPFTAWYRAHRSWDGAGSPFAPPGPAPYALVLVARDRVIASSDPRLGGAIAVAARGELHVTREGTSGSAGYDVRLRGAPSETVAAGGTEAGRLYLVPGPAMLAVASPPGTDGSARDRFVRFVAIVAAGAVLTGIWLATAVVRPIRDLTRAARAASSATVPHVPERSHDEIGDLARAFNALGERLMRSEAARRSVVGDVAHELRTPLTNIRCAMEAFADGVDEPSPAALGSVLDDVLLLQRLVGDLHELSLGDAVPSLAVRPTDLAREARSAVAAFAERASARDVRIDVTADEGAPLVACDPARVRQVLHNLLENALRYGKSGGCVSVAVTHGPQHVRVAVADDGEGFAASDEVAIFERFRRLDVSRSRRTGGSGLGLAIAKQVVEMHGGAIGASGGDGRGATLWFTLPR